MKNLYHLTRREYIPSIMQRGLIPGFSRGITCNRKKREFVFLTDDVRIPIEQLGATYSLENWAILIIGVDGLRVEPYRANWLYGQIIPNEFVTRTTVHSHRIKIQTLEI